MAGTEDPNDVFNFYFQKGIKSADFKLLLEKINESTDYQFHKIEKNPTSSPGQDSFKLSQSKYKIDSLFNLFGDQKELNKNKGSSPNIVNIVTYVKKNFQDGDSAGYETYTSATEYINDRISNEGDKFLFKIVKEGMYINHTIASLLFAILCSSTILKSAEKTIDGIFNVDPERAYCENVQVGLKKANIIPFKNENTELFDINNNKDAVINTETFQIKSNVGATVDDGASPGHTAIRQQQAADAATSDGADATAAGTADRSSASDGDDDPSAVPAADRSSSSDGDEDLPPGWASEVDEDTGKKYYYKTEPDGTDVVLPLDWMPFVDQGNTYYYKTEPDGTDVVLPLNWMPVIDKQTGNTYYYNVETRESTWDLPSKVVIPILIITIHNRMKIVKFLILQSFYNQC